MSSVIDLLGAIALLLFGLRQVKNGMMRAYGTELKVLSRRAEERKSPAFLAGLCVAVLLQSSTAAAMITASFAGQGVVSVSTAFITILGADIGTAIAAVLASQKVAFISPVLICCGFFAGQVAQQPRTVGVAKAILGMGLVLLGLGLVSSVSANIGKQPDFLTVLDVFTRYPVLIAVLGAIVAVLAHSSLAVILLTTGFITSGALSTQSGIYLMLGANAGGALLPLLANLHEQQSAKIPVMANLLVRGVCVVACFPLTPIIADTLSAWVAMAFVPIAAHVGLNLVIACVGILGCALWIRAASFFVKADDLGKAEVGPQFLSTDTYDTPSKALAQAKREALGMANISQTVRRQGFWDQWGLN